ncbi:MAG: acyl carrier protein [Nitriliruptorales bacterium]
MTTLDAPTDRSLYEQFRSLTAEVLEVALDQVTAGASFSDDLGADSLDLVELVEAMEEAFGIRIADEDLVDVTTVGEAFALLGESVVAA